MFFVLLTLFFTTLITGAVLIIKGQFLFGGVIIGLAIIISLFIYYHYKKTKHKRKDWDCVPYCAPDCGDCKGHKGLDCGPDLDCSPDCN